MPEYLAPGVYVEETSFRAKSIEGVGTSVAAIVGPTRFGPLRGKPEVVTSFAQYVRVFGDARDLEYGGTPVTNHTALGALAFFNNGGKQLFVMRVVNGVNDGDAEEAGNAARAQRADDSGVVNFRARFAGRYGRFFLELRWRDSQNLLVFDGTTDPAVGVPVLLNVSGVDKTAFVGAVSLADDKFPVSIHAIVSRGASNRLTIATDRAIILDKNGAAVPMVQVDDELAMANLPAGWRAVSATLAAPPSGALANGSLMMLTLRQQVPAALHPLVGNLGSATTLFGTVDLGGGRLAFSVARNPALAADVAMPFAALAALQDYATSLIVHRTFDIDVLAGPELARSESIRTYGGVSMSATGPTSLPERLPEKPARRDDWLTSPISCGLKAGSTGAQIYDALLSLCEPTLLGGAGFKEPRYVIALQEGSDGTAPVAADYGGETDEQNGSTGLAALEDIEDVSIVIAPHAATLDDSGLRGVVAELQKHCRRMRYRMAVLDSRQGLALSEVRDFAGKFDDSRLALYYPWVVTSDPNGQKPEVATPPSGFIAGVYAYTDVSRGVHKAPANEVMVGVLRFETEVNRFQQELLNPDGVNCLRSFPGRGLRVWGGRTRSSDPEWKYVNVRRYFLYLERSIEKSTQWVVFEPNGESLWDNLRQTVDSFLFNEWRNGRLLGADPKAAYFVRCDRSTMTQNDIDNGRLVCLIGVAPLRPAEFVIFRIGQKTADA